MAEAAGERRYRAACTPSGALVVLGVRPGAALHCAGRALLRVFRGRAEVLGFQPRPGVYYSLHSPKWSNLLVLSAMAEPAEQQGLVARFGEPAARLLRLMEPAVADTLRTRTHEEEDGASMEEEERAADELAAEIADAFPVVLIFRAIPVTFGNLMSYYEGVSKPLEALAAGGNGCSSGSATGGSAAPVVLPGFKLVIAKYNQSEWREAADGWDKAVPPADPSERQASHAWKSPARVFAELAVLDSLRVLQVTNAWRATAERLEQSLLDPGSTAASRRVVVCGAKGVGKSTFCRFLVNRLLTHFPVVAFLDTDLGQSELTPPGMVSLHALASPLLGPGFSQMRTPLRAFFCGAANPGNDPLFYMDAVKRLLRLCASKPQLAAVPLVVNTDGWIKSMGHDLLCHVIQEANPAHVVQLLAATKNKQFDVPTGDGEGKTWAVHPVEPWDPTGTAQSARSAKETRLYRLHTYFLSRRLAESGELARDRLQNLHVLSEKNRLDAELARAYANLPPVAVSFDAVDVAFAGSSVPPSQLLWSLNASLVGLCVNPSRGTSPGESVAGDDDNRPPRVLLGSVAAPCLGVGIVRAVDAQRRLLLIATPLPLATVERVNLLVRSSLPIDELLLAGAGGKSDAGVEDAASLPPQAPYVVSDVVAARGTGSAAMQSRNNLKRKRDDRGGRA